MALDPRMILQGAQTALAAGQSNPLGAIQQGQQLQQNILRQQAQEQAIRQAEAEAPLRQTLMQQQVEQGRLGLQETMAQMDQATRDRSALGMVNLASQAAVLPLEQQVSFVRENARQLDIPDVADLSDFIVNASDEEIIEAIPNLVNLGIQQGVIESDTASKIKQQQLDLREQELALKQQTEKRQATKLSAASEKALIESQDKALQASQNATEFDILANQLERSDLPGGVVSSFEEGVARFLGTQDEATELRRRYNKVRLSEGLKNLPPGPATDRDVQEAFKGVPEENAPASQMVSFLRGAAKMAKFDQAWNEFKSKYISANNNTKGLIPAWKAHAETIAGGIVENQESRPAANTFTSSSGIKFTVE